MKKPAKKAREWILFVAHRQAWVASGRLTPARLARAAQRGLEYVLVREVLPKKRTPKRGGK